MTRITCAGHFIVSKWRENSPSGGSWIAVRCRAATAGHRVATQMISAAGLEAEVK